VGGKTFEQRVEVKDDPRIDATPADRKVWTDFQMQVAAAIRQFAPIADKVQRAPAGDAARTDLKRESRELLSRLGRLFGETGRWVGRPTADQQSEFKFYQEMAMKLAAAAAGL
jgi:hypothetical protein